MKTAMELALARIELMKDINPDSVRWQMFKENYMQQEKKQIINAHGLRYSDITEETVNGEEYYNETFNQEPKKEYQPSEKYLTKQKELMEDFIWNKMNKNK